jgi:prepilin-type N-terminal cleavage/methylation domain-containing protein
MSIKAQMKQKSGFTLIEVMIALTVLAAGLLALATMQIVSIRSNAFSTEMTYATMLAQSQFEQLRNMDYADIPSSGSTIIPATATSKGIPYTIQRTVQPNIPVQDMTTILLSVTWLGAPAGSATGDTTVNYKANFTTVIAR